MRLHYIALALISSGCLEERMGRLRADSGPAAEVDTGDDTLSQTLVEIPFHIRTLAGPIRAETCYDVQVLQGDRVTWSRGDPTTNARGAPQIGPLDERLPSRAPDEDTLCAEGGDISWTATCDPRLDADPSRPGAQAELRVFFDHAPWDYPAEMTPPCIEGCTVAFDCAERQLPLTLDLALSLQIGRGFADPYNTLGEFACSTRRTSCFEYLIREDGQRGESTLLAFACAWSGANEPSLLNLAHGRLALGSVAVICDGQRLTLAPITQEIAEAGNGDLRLRYLALFGLEALQENLIKLYYNVVIETENLVGFDSCRVEWSATAYSTADALFDRDEAVADALVYPFFVVEADLSREGELICDADIDELSVRADAVLFGTVPEYPPLPARCFEFDGHPPGPTGHPGCD